MTITQSQSPHTSEIIPPITKKERRKLRREEQTRERMNQRKNLERKKIIKTILSISATLIVVGGIAILVINASKPIGETTKNLGNDHIDDITSPHEPYASSPPTSGPHVSNTADWGIHDKEIPDELQVHNLEDGGVVIQYHPEKLTDEEIKQLEDIINTSKRKHLILAPYSKMPHKIVLTAWTRLLSLDAVDEKQITAFINKYEGSDHHVKIPGITP